MEHTHTPSIRLQPTTDHHYDTISAISQAEEAEDEHTLSAYGDISLSEIIVPPLPAPTHLSPMEPRNPQPRLRLKVRRPPMPKRRSSYAYMPDPLPYTGGLDPDDRWSGSPRPLVKVSASDHVAPPFAHDNFGFLLRVSPGSNISHVYPPFPSLL